MGILIFGVGILGLKHQGCFWVFWVKGFGAFRGQLFRVWEVVT